ncbi:MMPL family transporter [Sulfurimonas sp. MAG313]|nr:MMPL family transporter [Sulfurimonas sp. MAG313]MDF1881975.1 MMPL family transporter [Sulfurimonas sp. MAG313]
MLKKFYKNIIFVHPRMVLSFLFLLISFLGFHALSLKVDASPETLLLENDKALSYTRLIAKRYRSSEFLVIAYTPNKSILHPDTLKNIKYLSDELLELPLVESITSVRNVPLVQSPPLPIKDLASHVPSIEDGIIDLELAKKELLSNPLYTKNIVSEDFKTTTILINLVKDTRYNTLLDNRNASREKAEADNAGQEDKAAYKTAQDIFFSYRDKARKVQHQNILSIRSIMQKYQDQGQMFLGGINMISDDLISFVKQDLKTYGLIVLFLLIIIFSLIFREFIWVILSLITLFASLIASIGFLGLFNFEVTVISSNYISLQLILTTSIIMHLIVRYEELAKRFPSQSQKRLVLHTVLTMSKPTFYAVITTIAGFISLMLSGILPVINLGWMMSAGLIISFIISYTLFPSFLILLKPILCNNPKSSSCPFTGMMVNTAKNKSKLIFLSTFIILVFSLFGTQYLRVENSFISYFKSSTEIYKGMAIIDKKLGGTTPLDITIDFPQEEHIPKSAPPVNQNEDEDDFFDEFEEEFEEAKGQDYYWFTSDKMECIRDVHSYLKNTPEIGKTLSFGTMLELGKTLNNGKDLDSFALALLYKELPDEFSNLIVKPYLSLENNQARFYVRIIDSDPNLHRDALLKKIKNDLHTQLDIPKENIHLSGAMVLYNNMLQSLFSSQILSLGSMISLLFIMFWFIFSSVKTAFIAMIANLVPISVVFGLMGWLNIPLDMMTITIASISIGIAVDNTIHYLHRFKKEFHLSKNYLLSLERSHASIGFAMSYTSASIIIGFLVLTMSPFVPTIYFGLLTVVAMLVALLADLLLLPRLILLFKVFGKELR